MHNIYTTKAIIIKSVSIGEANKLYFLITKDLGFVKATAQGVRLAKSKLKPSLQDFYYSNISLVKGKEIWRITSAQNIQQVNLKDNLDKIHVIKNIFSLLLRLIHGEDKNEQLFDCIEELYNFIFENTFSADDLKNLETLTVLRILYNLGYFKKIDNLTEYCFNSRLDFSVLKSFSSKRKDTILEINMALKETHL